MSDDGGLDLGFPALFHIPEYGIKMVDGYKLVVNAGLLKTREICDGQSTEQ